MNHQSIIVYVLAFIMSLNILIPVNSNAQGRKVILAIFAHPDDEATVTPVLAKYASEGVSVYIAVATDGRYGVNDFARIPEGDSLAAFRMEEMKCAAQKLGINPPIMMGLHDQLRMYEGMDTMTAQLNIIRDRVADLFTSLRPDVVITWGPSGWTGHTDHRLVGCVVSEVFQSRSWGKPANLFYPELVSGSWKSSIFPMAMADSAYLPVRIPVSKYYFEKARASHGCHKSQYTPTTAAEIQKAMWDSQKGVAYFRPFIMKSKRQDSLFE